MAVKASVILPHHNRSDVLGLTLDALAAQTIEPGRFEVILVDDGSTDGWSASIQEKRFPYSFQMLQQVNQGPGAARNRGAQIAQAAVLIFLDADMAPDQRLVEEYLASFAAQPQALVIGRQQLYPGAYPEDFARIYRSALASDLGPEAILPDFHGMASGNFAIDRGSFFLLNGFDENLRMAEDVDLGYRAYQQKTPLLYNPRAIGYHNHPKTLKTIYEQSRISAGWTAQLMAKHPQIRGQIPIYRPLEPIDAYNDGLRLIAQKLWYRLLASAPGHFILKLIERLAQKVAAPPRLLRYLFYRNLMVNLYLGFR